MRILVATDGSDSAGAAVDLVGSLPNVTENTVRLVTVLPDRADLFAGPWPAATYVMPDVEETAAQDLRSMLGRKVDRLGDSAARVEPALLRGRPATVIVQDATDWKADLVIVGSRGHGLLASMVLGSVAEEVIDASPVPVLVVRRPHLRRAVLATDGSPAAAAAVEFVKSVGFLADLPMTVVSVAPPRFPWWLGVGDLNAETVDAQIKAHETLRIEHRNVAAETATSLGRRPGQIEVRCPEGDAALEIVATAVALDADLIAVGSRGQTGLKRMVLGSVARNVLHHAPCSVLVVHPVQRVP